MTRGSAAVAGRPAGRGDEGRADGPPVPRQACEICEWARQCGSRVWECYACGRRRDFRSGTQFELYRDDGEPNADGRGQ